MTSLRNTASEEQFFLSKTIDCKKKFDEHGRRRGLKFKPKCNKVLDRKLRKYRLRLDGKEDQDVLDMSETLISILKIKSPNQKRLEEVNSVAVRSEKTIPKNYLFRMVRRKHNIKVNKLGQDNMVESTSFASPLVDNNLERRHTNAFKLLMDSRNKSIGGNSPGKERVSDEFDTQEAIEKKDMKAKRQLVLQKMANAKGALKHKEVEEIRERIVKQTMKKRADKFKSMLLNNDPKHLEETAKVSCQIEGDKLNPMSHTNVHIESIVSDTRKKPKTLYDVDIFGLTQFPCKASPEKKVISKEDEEFLKKLSPSLRKKENMLCYFKKVDKEIDEDENSLIIKVKLAPKAKKKGKKKKLSLNKDIINTEVEKEPVIEETNGTNSSTPMEDVKRNEVARKRKHKEITPAVNTEALEPSPKQYNRPKRSLKKPIKYNDDEFFTSSDEELHIFTPKKKKHITMKLNQTIVISEEDEENIHTKVKEKIATKLVPPPKKNTSKLAPIFTVKTQADLAAMEAKQKFLQSGVPDKLKKIVAHQKGRNPEHNSFFHVVHVQQLNIPLVVENFHNITEMNHEDESINIKSDDNLFKQLLNLKTHVDVKRQSNYIRNTPFLLQNIKESYPKFPVYRTYRLLRDRSKGENKNNNYQDIDNSMELLNGEVELYNDNPDRLSWTDKYRAASSNDIIGNFDSVKELKKWLEHWTENNIKSKHNINGNTGSDSSDFYASDVDSRDSLRSSNNLLILTGPVGSGKTSCVYAVAAELAIKVIEVNASSKRTGKIMLQDLQEATQSHKVNRGNLGSDISQKSQDIIKIDLLKKKTRGRPKKNVDLDPKKSVVIKKKEGSSGVGLSQEASRTAMSLILIDDADIVFDQDDGFCSAIVQLVQSSKRPVILVTGSLGCPHLQRFIQGGKILKMNPLAPRVLGTWLDIMCLADSGICIPGIGAKFLNYYQGDIRKTINILQFYISTQPQGTLDNGPASQNSDQFNGAMDVDENSSLSWLDGDIPDERNIMTAKDIDIVWQCFVDQQVNWMQLTYPLKLFNIWWSLPSLLNFSIRKSTTTSEEEIVSAKCKAKIIKALESVADAVNSISISDYLRDSKSETEVDITSQPWYSSECNSVSEQENLENFNANYVTIEEISHNIVSRSIVMAQKTLECPSKKEQHFQEMDKQRERDQISSRHNGLTEFLNPCAVLDRRSLALDYWSSCRTICRVEKSKTDTNYKRKNRFCHYLKSLNVLCKNEYFDHLCNSLNTSSKTDMSQ